MGILKSLFGGSNKAKPTISWKLLTDSDQLDTIITSSFTKYQAIFKHSTRCGISSGVLRQFERQEESDAIDFYFIDILKYRPVSNTIASKFGILHESPQLIVIKNGEVWAHGSHYDIMSISLEDF